MPAFRIHIEGAEAPMIVDAPTPGAARDLAVKRQPGAVIRKIKIDRADARPSRGQRRANRGDFR